MLIQFCSVVFWWNAFLVSTDAFSVHSTTFLPTQPLSVLRKQQLPLQSHRNYYYATRITGLWGTSNPKDNVNQDDEMEETGGDPSFLLDDPLANGGDADFGKTSQQELRDEEIAAILELGGDPSFLMDVVSPELPTSPFKKDDQLSTDRVYTPQKFHVDPEEAAALEAAGGDPFFLPDIRESQPPTMDDSDEEEEGFDNSFDLVDELEAMGGDPSFLEEAPAMSSPPPPSSSAFSARDLLSLGRDPTILKHGPPQPQPAIDVEELEAMAGDPSFLDDIAEVGGDPSFLVGGNLGPAKNDQPYYTAMEGESFDSLRDEVEALGGDPFFLVDDDDDDDNEESDGSKQYSHDLDTNPVGGDDKPYYTAMEGESFDNLRDEVEALGGDPFFLVDDDEPNEREDELHEDASIASPLSGLASDPSFLLQYVQKQENPPPAVVDHKSVSSNESNNNTPKQRHRLRKSPITNEVIEEEVLSEEEDLLAVGGDPAFLASYDENDTSNAYDMEVQRAEIEEMGGDPSFL